MASTPITRTMNASSKLIPASLWRQPVVPSMMGLIAGRLLRSGRMALHGAVPNGQQFLSHPPRIWTVADTSATLAGQDLGAPGPLRVQDHLEDFWLPQRGLFFAGSVLFESYDEDRHLLVSTRAAMPSTPG